MLCDAGFIDNVILGGLLVLLDLLEVVLKPFFLFEVRLNLFLDYFLLIPQFLHLPFEEEPELFLASVMLLDESPFNFVKHTIQLTNRFVVAPKELLFDK